MTNQQAKSIFRELFEKDLTRDNIFTAICFDRTSNLIEDKIKVFTCEIEEDEKETNFNELIEKEIEKDII